MTDLFLKNKTDKERLLDFIRDRRWVKTSDVIRFALQNYSNRGDRNARLLAQENRIRRLSKQDKLRIFGEIKEEAYEFIQ